MSALKPTNALLAPQPPPVAAEGDLWLDVIADGKGHYAPELLADMAARREQGIEKYGRPLALGNERSFKADAYQEALDGVVYAYGRARQLAEVDLHGAELWMDVAYSFGWLAERIRSAP